MRHAQTVDETRSERSENDARVSDRPNRFARAISRYHDYVYIDHVVNFWNFLFCLSGIGVRRPIGVQKSGQSGRERILESH
jgi:hypothetical protein